MALPSLPEEAAIILAGGKSSRMGRDKASIEIAGVPLLAIVVARVRQVVDTCVVAAAPDQTLPALPEGVLVVRDPFAHRGPLVALEHAMSALPPAVERCFVCGTDLPSLNPAVVRRLLVLAVGHEITVVDRDGLQLLAGVYATALQPQMSALIQNGASSMKALLRHAASRIVTIDELYADPAVRTADPTLSTFDDVDSPADLALRS